MDPARQAKEDKSGNEAEFSKQLRDVERRMVQSVVAGGTPDAKVTFKILNNARGLAEMTCEGSGPRDARAVACKEGCSWCCHQQVWVSAAEAVSIVEHLRGMRDMALRDVMLEKIQRFDEESRGMSSEEWDAMRAPCPFLTEGRCGIYSARPLVCAAYTSYDVGECEVRYRVGVEKSVIHGDRARRLIYDSVQMGMCDGLEQMLPEIDSARLELTAAVTDALKWEDPEAEWLAGRPIFANARIVNKAE